MSDIELIKLAIARTASETDLRSEHRALLERLLDHISKLEGKREVSK